MKNLFSTVALLTSIMLLLAYGGPSKAGGSASQPGNLNWAAPVTVSAGPTLPYSVLHKDNHPVQLSTNYKQIKVLSSQDEYLEEVAKYTGDATNAQRLDFSKGKVLLVDMGERPSGGYDVEISSVVSGSDWVAAHIELRRPGLSCQVSFALTQPYLFVYIPSRKEVLARERLQTVPC